MDKKRIIALALRAKRPSDPIRSMMLLITRNARVLPDRSRQNAVMKIVTIIHQLPSETGSRKIEDRRWKPSHSKNEPTARTECA